MNTKCICITTSVITTIVVILLFGIGKSKIFKKLYDVMKNEDLDCWNCQYFVEPDFD